MTTAFIAFALFYIMIVMPVLMLRCLFAEEIRDGRLP